MLRLRALGEADRIVTLFSRERGKISAVARGVRKPQSRFGGRLDFFTRVGATLHSGRSLEVITAVRTVRAIWEQLVNPEAFAAASYVAEVVDSLSEPDMAVAELYNALTEFQDTLARTPASDGLLAAMDLRVLSALGFAPEFEACARCGAVLGRRPLLGGRAWLSPHAGGLLCNSCVRSVRNPEAGAEMKLLSLSAADFATLNVLRTTPLSAAHDVHVSVPLHRATRAFVEFQMGRRSKVFSTERIKQRALVHKT